ncbi:ribosome maturation factor RimM [Actinobaculum massiliense]|uniref:ribosome maturation factor RimM n=1 Tax=Actinobaculum massiliense TaxID=202789 RepID=UPI00288AA0A2|nr:ribosome maturation factor RimM [Actinobaculum massiliense]
MQLTVAIVGAAKGLKGEVRLEIRTDDPEKRLAVGNTLETEPSEFGPLTVARTRTYKGSTYALFEEVGNRNAAEELKGVRLVIESDEDEPEADAWYPHELVGLEVLDPEGYELGTVSGIEHGVAQDLLVVREPDGRLTRVPFVSQIVIDVDLDDHCVVVDAPPGLFSEEDIIVVEGED